MKSLVEGLREAKQAISKPKDWYPGPGPGNCNPRMCVLEALAAVIPVPRLSEALGLLYESARKLGFVDPVALNNAADHKMAMRLYDEAIRLAVLGRA